MQWAWVVAWNIEVKSNRKNKKRKKEKARSPAAIAFDFLIMSVSEDSRDGNEKGCTCEAVILAIIVFMDFQQARKGQSIRILIRNSCGPPSK